MRRTRGFTLIELMIVVAIIAIIAAIAIPNLLAARLAANETSSISTLRNLTSCQGQFQASAKCDVDRDGTGEFGVFRELTGAAPVRTALDGSNTGGATLNPPVLSSAFRTLTANSSEATRSGYRFKIFIPTSAGAGSNEPAGLTGNFWGNPDPDLCETTWCCYSFPVSYSNSGNRTFFVNQGGDITATESSGYTSSHVFRQDNAGMAFGPYGGAATNITGKPAMGTRGRDGNTWKQVN